MFSDSTAIMFLLIKLHIISIYCSTRYAYDILDFCSVTQRIELDFNMRHIRLSKPAVFLPLPPPLSVLWRLDFDLHTENRNWSQAKQSTPDRRRARDSKVEQKLRYLFINKFFDRRKKKLNKFVYHIYIIYIYSFTYRWVYYKAINMYVWLANWSRGFPSRKCRNYLLKVIHYLSRSLCLFLYFCVLP